MKVRDDIRKITMYKTSFCADCKRAEIFFEKYRIEYVPVNIDDDETAATLVMELNNGNRTVPTIVIDFKDDVDKILVEPGFDELEEVFLV
ncbi:MAG: glutaredoxin family protein [Candidatus Dojkabacteria bacterium]